MIESRNVICLILFVLMVFTVGNEIKIQSYKFLCDISTEEIPDQNTQDIEDETFDTTYYISNDITLHFFDLKLNGNILNKQTTHLLDKGFLSITTPPPDNTAI